MGTGCMELPQHVSYGKYTELSGVLLWQKFNRILAILSMSGYSSDHETSSNWENSPGLKNVVFEGILDLLDLLLTRKEYCIFIR